MTASSLAKRLRDRGFPVTSFREGDEMEDGEVTLTDLVHVQVGFYDGQAGVVKQDGDEFEFFPLRGGGDVVGLVSDLAKAGVVPA